MSRQSELAELSRIYDSSALSNRNLIINGAMEVAQRGTSVTGSTAGGTIHTVDRFFNHASGATYDSTQESVTLGGETGLPVQFKNYHKFNVTTGANNCAVWQTVEDVTKVQGTHTLSFYAKGVNPAGGNIDVTTRQDFGTSGSTAVDTTLGNFVLTSTWQRFTFTFDAASVAGKTINASNYFRVMFHQPNADNGTAAWNLQITGVQLEVGDTATPFEHRSYGDELARCLRYYEKLSGSGPSGNYAGLAIGFANSGGTSGPFYVKASPKRTDPSITSTGTLRVISALTSGTFSLNGDSYINKAGSGYFNASSFSPSITAGHSVVMTANNDADAGLILDAEL